MRTAELYELLELRSDVVEELIRCRNAFSLEQTEPFLLGMMNGETAPHAYADLKTFLGEDEGSFHMLLCQLECARRRHDAYRAMGIPDHIFADTMKCFTRFLRECEQKTGEMYFDRGWWTYRQISMRLFRVGELEYELYSSATEKLVHLHIPSDAVLTPEKVDESLEAGERFVAKYFPEYRDAQRVCDSWLLSPQLKCLLPKESNILRFQSRFAILEENAKGKEFMEWIFRAPADADPSGLPENTSLQRNAKRLLLAGGNVGSAYGVLR